MRWPRVELARDRKLHNEGVIAERRLLESQSNQRELSTMVDQRRQLLQLSGFSAADIDALTQSRQLSSSLPVHTPIGGVVLEQMVSTGQSVAAASPLYRVAELKPLWVEVHVPVESLGGLRLGAPVVLPTLGIEGQIITIGRMVHSEDQGVLVRAEIQTGTEKLRPGQFVEVQLSAAPTEGGSWRVPSAAVVRYAGSATSSRPVTAALPRCRSRSWWRKNAPRSSAAISPSRTAWRSAGWWH